MSANKLTTAANAIVLQFTSPIFIMLFLAALYGQKFMPSDYITVFATFCGIAVFFLSDLHGGQMKGNLVGVLDGVFMAGM